MRKLEKVKYEIDPNGRLKLMRTVIDAEFHIDKNNTLVYRVKKPISSSIPQQLKLSGNWTLDNNHNLILTLDKENNQWLGNKLTLEGEIITADADALVFSISTKDSNNRSHFYTLKFSGRWQADEYNRLSFLVTKAKDVYDELAFCGSWEVNKQNQLIYTYTQTKLKRKEKLTRSLTFKGYWDINEKNRISYVLNKELNSGFDFKVSLGKPAKRGLEYEIGIGVSPKKEKFTLFGSWKINEKVGASFEMPYKQGKIRSLIFGATCKLDKQMNLELSLKNTFHDNLGINLKLSRSILKGAGSAFAEALKEGKEISVLAGAGFRW